MLRQSPFIKDAIVVGFYDEETKDYEPAALIVPDLTYTGEAYGIDFTDEELEGAVGEWVTEMNEGLPQYKQITLFALRETPFPRNAAGRVMRAVLAEEMPFGPETPTVRHRRSERHEKKKFNLPGFFGNDESGDDELLDGLPPAVRKEDAFHAPVYPEYMNKDERHV